MFFCVTIPHNERFFFLPTYFFLFTLIAFILQSMPAEALCIKNKEANLREGPGKNYKKIWRVLKYMPFKKIGKEGNWIRVKDLDKDTYWVHQSLTTEKYMCAVIKKDKTNARQKPGRKNPQVEWSPINKYFSMKVLEIKGAWVHIEDSSGDQAWIYRPLVWVQ
jgi:SH3-like domain-containing protein